MKFSATTVPHLETSSRIKSTVPSRSNGEAKSPESVEDPVSGGDNAKDGHDGDDWKSRKNFQIWKEKKAVKS